MGKKEKKEKKPKEVIEGLEIIDPTTLRQEFRRFRHDDLYFIEVIQYQRPNEKPVSRCVALTPVAFFITDINGNMDRATRCELLSEAYYQIKTIKKLFSSEEQVQFIIKIPKEFDVRFTFEKEKDNKSALKFADTLNKLCAYRQKNDFKTKIVPPEANFDEYYNAEAPKGYMSPQEIIKANNERKQQQEQIQLTSNEIVKLQKQLEIMKKATAEKQATLSKLEAAVGVDHSSLRADKDRLSQLHKDAHQKHTGLEIDMVKLSADISRAEEQLVEQRENREKMIQEKIQDADNSVVNQQNEMMLLRQKAQKREIDKAQVKLDNLRAKLATPSEYTGPENLVTRVNELEKKVEQAQKRWELEMESANKVDKFLDTINMEIERVGRCVSELHDEKTDLLEERENKLRAGQEAQQKQQEDAAPAADPVAAPAPAAGADPLGDDDLLGGSSPAPAAAAKPAVDLDDDDLLGGGGAPAPAPAAAAAPAADVLDDDDLLGGGGAPAPAPAPAAAPAADVLDDDDLLGGGSPAPAPAAKPAATAVDLDDDLI